MEKTVVFVVKNLKSLIIQGFKVNTVSVVIFNGVFMLEKEIEKYFKAKIEDNNGMCIKLTSMVGLPDRLILLPVGRIFFVEFKQKGKKPRKVQSFIHRRLKDLGFKVYVIDDKYKMEEVFKEWNLYLTSIKKQQLTK